MQGTAAEKNRDHHPLVAGLARIAPLFKFPFTTVLNWYLSVLLDLVKKVNPLPWTTDGPNDNSKPQQTASISPTVSVVDQTYQYKNKVIDMKQVEVIKERQPRGIDVRISSKNVLFPSALS